MCSSGSEDVPECTENGDQPAGGATATCSHHIPDFSVSIDLPESNEDDMLTPLSLSGNWRDSKVRFDIEIESDDPSFQADQTEIVVMRDGFTLFNKVFTSEMVTVGEFAWWWDGYNNSSVLETARLIGTGLTVTVYVSKGGTTKSATEELANEYEKVEWVDVTVDLPAHKVQINVYVDCQNESDLPAADFANLKAMALAGLGYYWSRTITVGGEAFAVTTTAIQREERSEDLDLYLETGTSYSRSHNTGIVDASIIYNQGFYGSNVTGAQNNFMFTAAHEFGHAVLEAYGGQELSWGHKGTVHQLFQYALDEAPSYPSSGEIDLMYYYNGDMPADFYNRVIAAEEDVRRLIWCSMIDFDEA